MNSKSGHCLCGAVRFTATRWDENVGICHCGMCQRWAGGPFISVTLPVDAVTVAGADRIVTRETSDWATRSRCGDCGSPLWYQQKGGTEYYTAIGLFDDHDGLVLHHEIFIDRKPGTYAFAGEHERETEAETMARFASSE